MRPPFCGTILHLVVSLGAAAALAGTLAEPLAAQGCEPIRLNAGSFGGTGGSIQKAGEWRLSLGYRHLFSNQFFVGTQNRPQDGPGGQSTVIELHSFVADLGYSVTDRLTVRLAAPFSTGKVGRVWPDHAWHNQTASGIGDITLTADSWVLDPSTHLGANFSFGVGIQAPTGRHAVGSQFYLASGPVAFPADMAVEPGSGGWGFTVQTRGFAKLFERGFGYWSGSYTFAPEATTDILNAPPPKGFLWAVADGYAGRLGLSYALLPTGGLSLSLGGRIDGTPVRDVFGAGAEAFRRPGYVIYAEPGISLSRGSNTLSLSVPWRLRANRIRSILERTNPLFDPLTVPVGGGFAKSLIFFSYARRL